MNSSDQKLCAVVPCYRHSKTLKTVIDRIRPFIKSCIVVDDGSPESEANEIRTTCESFDNVTLVRLDKNRGKGYAVMAGLKAARNLGFTHARIH